MQRFSKTLSVNYKSEEGSCSIFNWTGNTEENKVFITMRQLAYSEIYAEDIFVINWEQKGIMNLKKLTFLLLLHNYHSRTLKHYFILNKDMACESGLMPINRLIEHYFIPHHQGNPCFMTHYCL